MAEKLTETRAEATHRLAKYAEQKGVRVYQHPATGEYLVSSVSQPGTLHRVTPDGCDCEGWSWTGRCSHHAALLAHLDALPRLQPCDACDGTGQITYPVRITPTGKTVYDAIPCGRCEGTGNGRAEAHAA